MAQINMQGYLHFCMLSHVNYFEINVQYTLVCNCTSPKNNLVRTADRIVPNI